MNSCNIALLQRVADLARRNGLRPSEAAADLHFEWDDDGKGEYILKFSGIPTDPDKMQRHKHVLSLLGCEGSTLKTDHLFEMEDAVERAVSLSPRSRTL